MQLYISVPLCPDAPADRCIWHYGRDGEYIVRSAYRLVMEGLADMSHLHVHGELVKLWRLEIPPKSEEFCMEGNLGGVTK